MSATTPPLAIGTASGSAALKKDLGKVYWVNGRAVRLVRQVLALSAAASKVIVSAATAGAPTWQMATSTSANDANPGGVIPAGQTGSTGTTGLIAGDYLLVYVSGACDIISAGAVAQYGLVGVSGTAGKGDDASITAGVGAWGVALEAAGGADEAMGCYLKGMI